MINKPYPSPPSLIDTPSNNTYLELELFKQHFHGKGAGGIQCTFAHCSHRVRNYRAIFFAIGILFFGLAVLIYQHNLIFFTLFFGNLSLLTKGILIGISSLFSFVSLFISYSMCVAREAGTFLFSKAKSKLFRLYTRKRFEQGLVGLFNFGTFCKNHYKLKHQYKEKLHQLEEFRDETLILLQKIQQYSSVEAHYRELLFNQALCEMHGKLQVKLQAFKELN